MDPGRSGSGGGAAGSRNGRLLMTRRAAATRSASAPWRGDWKTPAGADVLKRHRYTCPETTSQTTPRNSPNATPPMVGSNGGDLDPQTGPLTALEGRNPSSRGRSALTWRSAMPVDPCGMPVGLGHEQRLVSYSREAQRERGESPARVPGRVSSRMAVARFGPGATLSSRGLLAGWW